MEAASKPETETRTDCPQPMGVVEVHLWICPFDGTYHGNSGDHNRDLTRSVRRAKSEDNVIEDKTTKKVRSATTAELEAQRGNRSHCPICQVRGRGFVQREHVVLTIDLRHPQPVTTNPTTGQPVGTKVHGNAHYAIDDPQHLTAEA